MTTLLEFFDEHERKFKDAGAADLYRLKYFFEACEGTDIERLEWEMNLFFRLLEALRPQKLQVNVEKELRKPTLGAPTAFLRDSLGRDFSFWYKPYFLVPLADGPKTIKVDFVCVRGQHDSPYMLEQNALKQFDAVTPSRETGVRLLSRLKPVQLAILAKPRFSSVDAGDIKAVSYFLKPRNLFLTSQYEMPTILKAGLPLNTRFAEKVDLNFQKFVEAVKPLL
ncbi:hypothetical protein HY546_02675 [archaeon]|nr:hypothetical protein [archaeon]